MFLSITQLVDPGGAASPIFRATVYDRRGHGNTVLQQVPPRRPNSFPRINFWLDVDFDAGTTKQQLLSRLSNERAAFEKLLVEAPDLAAEDGVYYADTFSIRFDMQGFRDQAPGYYLEVFDACCLHLQSTSLTHLP